MKPALWFMARLFVGALWALTVLGMASIGILVLPFAILGTVGLWRRPGAGGILAGAGLFLLFIAWLNRHGPGQYCTSGDDWTSCSEQWNPWPWVVLGGFFVLAGIVRFVRQTAFKSSITARQRSGSAL